MEAKIGVMYLKECDYPSLLKDYNFVRALPSHKQVHGGELLGVYCNHYGLLEVILDKPPTCKTCANYVPKNAIEYIEL